MIATPPAASSPPASVEELRTRLSTLAAKLYDSTDTFSASAMIAEIDALLAYAKGKPGAETQLRDGHMMVGLLEEKRQRPVQAVAAFKRGFAVAGAAPQEPLRALWDNFHLADLAREDQDWLLAAKHYEAAASHMAGLTQFADTQRFGLISDQAFVLHEAGQYADALAVNQRLLADAERILSPTDADLRPVVINIAQNLHALGRKAEAEPYLVRALAIVRASKNVWYEQDLLFQTGVLAFELGRPADARKAMLERIDVINRCDHPDKAMLLLKAREDLAFLEDQISGG